MSEQKDLLNCWIEDANENSKRLQYIMDLQTNLNKRIGVPDFKKITESESAQWILKFTRSLMHEVIELERELPWKHWKKQQSFDVFKAKQEAIDCLHFLLSIFLALGMDADEVIFNYIRKNQINQKRQDDGY